MKTNAFQRHALSALLLTSGMLFLAAACGETAEAMGETQEMITRIACLAMSAVSFRLLRRVDSRFDTHRADDRKGEKS